MTDHKFEPFQKVLVRDFDTQNWNADLFSHIHSEVGDTLFACMGDASWLQCIPYTPETAHLLGTTQPYEPPKQPQEYEWGQKVEAFVEDDWESALYLKYDADDKDMPHEVHAVKSGIEWVASDKIRPLPDDTADSVKCGICGKLIDERTAANDVECWPCCPEHYEDTAAH